MSATAVKTRKARRYGMVVDVDRCTGCGACMVACAAENNVAEGAARANERTSISLIRVFALQSPDRQGRRTAYIPMMCMQCEHETPCIAVCPQQAVELDRLSGIVDQMPQRCLGCRYCMAACPYHARSFNWADPEWPAGMEATLNPAVAPRMRGVVEKCDFCQARLHAAQDKAAMNGDADPGAYTPACVEACPTQAIAFGDWEDKESAVSQSGDTFAWLEGLDTGPKVRYRTSQTWVKTLAQRGGAAPEKEVTRG
jgi:Fe-S-cluster-containing dehydrogenase component